jgi:hypothetical protein
MISLDAADDFTIELAQLMEKHGLGVFIDDCQELYIDSIYKEYIDEYTTELLDNTART